MICSFRLWLAVAVPFLGMAAGARADLSKLLEPVGGATLGRPGASLDRPEELAGGTGSPRKTEVASKAPLARIITTETPQ